MIRSFRHRGLQRYWTRSDSAGLRPDWVPKIERLLDALDLARRPQDLSIPGTGFHALRGNLKGRYAMTVSKNWRLTFAWDGEDAIDWIWRIIMAERSTRRDPNRPPVHPGAILREDVLPGIGEAVSIAARKLGVTRQHLHRILAEKAAVSPEMAIRLGKFCGNGPELWLRMQQAYDLWHAQRALKFEVAKIPTAKAKAA
jgi:antitoxin HigA-1